MATLFSVEFFDLYLPMRGTIRNVGNVRRVLLLKWATDSGTVWSECSSLDQPGYHYETIDVSWFALKHLILPKILGRRFFCLADVSTILTGILGFPFAKAAVDAAVAITLAQEANQSLARYLGHPAPQNRLGGTMSMDDVTPTAMDQVVAMGFKRVKLKISRLFSLEQLIAIRTYLPESIAVAVDANGIFGRDDIPTLKQLEWSGVAWIEQPFESGDWAANCEFRKVCGIPIVLDESISSQCDVATANTFDAADSVVIKIGRVGGISATLGMYTLASQLGISVSSGGMVDSPIGLATRLAVAGHYHEDRTGDWAPPEFTWDCDALHLFRFDYDINRMPLQTDSVGLGVTVDSARIHDVSVTHEIISAADFR
ncbi:hypothetical protein EB093_03795 [bacterium]|nr:hypothetical protein [bacterium]